MTDIPNTEYITINKDGIFVGGKPTTKYRGETIRYSNVMRVSFADIQRLNKNVAELHVLSSETFGEYTKVGNPSGNHGRTAWCRVKFENGNLGAWVFLDAHGSAANCAYYCAIRCAYGIRNLALFRSAVFGATINKTNAKLALKQNALTNALKNVDLSKFDGQSIELNGYRIMIEKTKQDITTKGK